MKDRCDTGKEKALAYHKENKPGKLEVVPTVPFETQCDMSLAYTPGVAHPCQMIEEDFSCAYEYTSKGNLVAVISNGTAVLGLGDIGALASKPVMEGKAILFKSFSNIDSFDIEVNQKDVDAFCTTVEAIAPTFGGINLEDIKAPECFEIEERLIESLDIPVMHDDQHGTAVISAAAMINAAKITNRKLDEMKVVIMGAGAAAIMCGKMYQSLGVKNIIMIDSKGVIDKTQENLSDYKKLFAVDKPISKQEAFENADMLLGLSRAGLVSEDNIQAMSDSPIVFTLANPTPEIFPHEVKAIKPNAIIATGRSDYPNQVNNVLGFPFIFRGALDVRSAKINQEMKIAAVHALANLAQEDVPDYINDIYGTKLVFGRDYLIPKPFDKRLLSKVSSAVAQAAVDSGVANIEEFHKNIYEQGLEEESKLK